MNEEVKETKEVTEVKTEETPKVDEKPVEVTAVAPQQPVDKKAAKKAAKVEAKVKKNLRDSQISLLENEVLLHPDNQEAIGQLVALKSERNKDTLKAAGKVVAVVAGGVGLVVGGVKLFTSAGNKSTSGDDSSVAVATFEEVNEN